MYFFVKLKIFLQPWHYKFVIQDCLFIRFIWYLVDSWGSLAWNSTSAVHTIPLWQTHYEFCYCICVFPLLLISMKCASHIGWETAIKNKQFKETKTLISNLCLIRQSFQVYRCKSSISTFEWSNYAYSPFKYS